jgi:hypothetical protein
MFESLRRSQNGDDMQTTADDHTWPHADETPSQDESDPGATHVIGRLRPSLASLMAEAGAASHEQLQQALAEGQQTGERLGEVVLRYGWINEADLANLIARQWDLSFVALSMIRVDEQARSLLSRDEAAHLGACPVGFDENRPLVAIADPSEVRFAAVRERLGATCAFLVTTQSALARLIEQTGAAAVAPEAAATAQDVVEPDPLPDVEDRLDSSFDLEPFSAPEHEPSAAAVVDEHQHDSSPAVDQLDRLIEQLLAERVHARDKLSAHRQRLAELNEEQARVQENVGTLEAKLGQEDRVLERMRAKLADLNGS